MLKLQKKSLSLSALIGLGCAVVLTGLFCLPFAAAVYHQALPLESAWMWAVLSAGLSVFVTTLVIARLRQRQALPTGGCIAGGFLLLAALVCALGGEGFLFGTWLLWLGGAVALGGLLGAVMSIRQNSHKKRRSRT